MNPNQASPEALALARQVLRIESDAVLALADRLDEAFLQALNLILNCSGRVIVSGMGKSGHIARKIAATWPVPAPRPSSCIRAKPVTVIWA